MSRIRVAYLIGQFPAINHFYLLQEIRSLRANGIDVKVASVNRPDRGIDQLRPEEREELGSIYCVKNESRNRAAAAQLRAFAGAPARFVRAFQLARFLAKSQRKPMSYAVFYLAEAVLIGKWLASAGIAHLHASFTSNIALIVAELFPVTFSFGVYGFGELYDPINNNLRLKIERARFVRSVSRDGVGQLMLASSPEYWDKLQYVGLGIDVAHSVAARQPKQPGAFELMCVGRLSPEKGYRILFRAVALLRQSGRAVTVRLVGDGPDRAELEREAARLGLTGAIVFEGWVEQQRLESLYAETDAFALTSLYEGIPIVLMEAMAREVPCVAARINGIPELIAHGKTGLLFSPADHDDLARCISTLIDSPEASAQLGRAARLHVASHFDIEKNTAELANLFRKQGGDS